MRRTLLNVLKIKTMEFYCLGFVRGELDATSGVEDAMTMIIAPLFLRKLQLESWLKDQEN
jgi:hypothetical protein